MDTPQAGTPPELVFDFGDGTPDDLQRVLQEARERHMAPKDLSKEEQDNMQSATLVSRDFLDFVAHTLVGMQLLDVHGSRRAPHLQPVPIPADGTPRAAHHALWKAYAPTWAVATSPQIYHATMQTILQFFRLNDRKPQERILSIGAGPGLYETYLAGTCALLPNALHREFISLDATRAMTEQHRACAAAARTMQGAPITNVRVVNGDMEALPFPDKSIDQILCIDALQWSLDWRATIKEMARVIDPSGLRNLLLIVRLQSPLFQNHPESPLMLDPEAFSIPTVLDALEVHGFQNTHLRQFAPMRRKEATTPTPSRVFIEAQYMPDGHITSWRTTVPSFSAQALHLG